MTEIRNTTRVVPNVAYSAADFARDAIQAFPELAWDLDEPEGIHITMGALWIAAREAIDDGNSGLFDRVAVFISNILAIPDADPEIENAIEISFLEHRVLMKSRKGRKAFKRLPDSIKKILERQEY